MRDNFSKLTVETIAKRAGGHCSNPACKRLTFGPKQGGDGFVNVGVAAHITAAAPGGPRYDPSLTPKQRQRQSNGIWLCQTHGKLVDSDEEHFTVEMLRKWKFTAEQQSWQEILVLQTDISRRIEPAVSDTTDAELIERLGLAQHEDLESVTRRLIGAAQTDLAAFKRMPGWPSHAIRLNLRMTDGDSARTFNVSALAEAVETFNEIVVIAPPGTGKTTTLLQVTEAILSKGNSAATYIPLSEWSAQSDSLFQSIVRRHAFAGLREAHLKLLAHYGRLVVVMDGWNELDPESKKRARLGIRALQRDFPCLGIIVSTRSQALGVPISWPVVEIDALTESQQLEIARQLRGLQGEALVDHAWRTAGVRELVRIPLYLTALLAHTPGGTLPTTKEEVLRLFITEYERATDKIEALHAALFGSHTEMLTALAVEATRAANTTISASQARALVKRVEGQLSVDGQMTIAPEPATVLDMLVNQHILVRSGAETGGLSFQHQQFQEWYASFEVEVLMRAAAAGNQEVRQKLKADVLNMSGWEEPILFACERVSRTDQGGVQAVAASILDATAIDPMLAAEMIYRSADDVWTKIKEKIISFVNRWHISGKADRAVNFMISTGRSEFGPQVWPLISTVDNQLYLKTLRAGHRFRPSVLGPQAQTRIAQLPEEVREHVVSEIAHRGDMEGIELAARLAKADASPKVQASVIEALHFRQADRFVAEILRVVPNEVLRLLARKGYAYEIAEQDAAVRLRDERQRYMQSEANPLRKIRMLLEAGRNGAPVGPDVRALIEAADFPIKDGEAGWVIAEAHKHYPNDVLSALLHRIEARQEIPFLTKDILRASNVLNDEGPLVDLVMDADAPERVAEAAVSIVGPLTVAKLIDKIVTTQGKVTTPQGAIDEPVRKHYWRLHDLISKTKLIAFVEAVLSRSMTDKPVDIALFADLVASHGKGESVGPFQLDAQLYERMIDTLGRWAESLLASPVATRAQIAEVARAIERLPSPQLVPVLRRMLEEDLARWRLSRDEFLDALSKGTRTQSDAQTSWTLQYSRAFAAIGDEHVVELMKTYLADAGYCGFGLDAARTLKAIYDRQKNSPRTVMSWPDFSDVKARRADRQDQSRRPESSEFANAIIRVVNDLIKPDVGQEVYRHGLRLATIALSMPYGDQTETIEKLLNLPLPLREKQTLLSVLVQAGETISVSMILDGIKTLLEEAKTERWRLGENQGELEGWLELLPFSDRPEATLDALELLEPNLRQPWRMRRLLSALRHAPSPEAERVLSLLPKKDARFFGEHDWFAALRDRGTTSSFRMILDFLSEGAFAGDNSEVDGWVVFNKLADAIRGNPDLRSEIYQRFEGMPTSPGKVVLERVIAEVADTEGVLILLRYHTAQGRPFADTSLPSAIRHASVGERPSDSWMGANEVFSVPLPELRKALFRMTNAETAEARLAATCLNTIDELRDEYGPAESEPRHPDIESGRPWPLAAG